MQVYRGHHKRHKVLDRSPLDNHKFLFFDQSQRTRLDSTLDHVHAVAKHSLDLQERSSMQDPAKVDLRTRTQTNKQAKIHTDTPTDTDRQSPALIQTWPRPHVAHVHVYVGMFVEGISKC